MGFLGWTAGHPRFQAAARCCYYLSPVRGPGSGHICQGRIVQATHCLTNISCKEKRSGTGNPRREQLGRGHIAIASKIRITYNDDLSSAQYLYLYLCSKLSAKCCWVFNFLTKRERVSILSKCCPYR